jgi:Luciferase-like monooxygenase
MRLGLVVSPSPGSDPARSLLAQARMCEEAGIELAWLAGADASSSLHRAALTAGATTSLRVVAEVVASGHPLRIAEEATVADNCSNGRLTLVLTEPPADDAGSRLAETADVVTAAAAGIPFRHSGRRWTIPAGLAANAGREAQVTVTPPSPQLEPPLWLAGPAAPAVARERGLSHVTGEDESRADADAAWSATASKLGRAAARLRRPALRRLRTSTAGGFDAGRLVDDLLAERATWGLDTAFIVLVDGLDDAARCAAVKRLADHVRPRTALHALPPGLERHWDEVLDGDGGA